MIKQKAGAVAMGTRTNACNGGRAITNGGETTHVPDQQATSIKYHKQLQHEQEQLVIARKIPIIRSVAKQD